MKTFKFILLALVVSNTITAQKNVRPTKNLDSYEGTWIYQKNDIIFKIKLQKGQEAWRNDLINGLYGGYYLSVNGRDSSTAERPLFRAGFRPERSSGRL